MRAYQKHDRACKKALTTFITVADMKGKCSMESTKSSRSFGLFSRLKIKPVVIKNMPAIICMRNGEKVRSRKCDARLLDKNIPTVAV